MNSVGVIIIGRNEGERLDRCLESVRAAAGAAVREIVYVDSNSDDNSIAIARAHGAQVIELDPAAPFTAARARNAGAKALLARHPDLELLQFLDGDTLLHPRWLAHAVEYLRHHPGVAVVCGRRRERHPEATLFNLLADMEWDTPLGPAREFGGDALFRAPVFLHLGGYNERFIAGEEPELAARLRLAGHGIVRLNHEMTQHDLNMTHFSQWWRRTVRSGHALAQLSHIHGGKPLHFYQHARRSTLFWGLAVPAGILFLSICFSFWFLSLFPLAYVYLAARIFRFRQSRGDDRESAAIYAFFTTLGKFPQTLGLVKFYWNLCLGRSSRLIEYKSAHPLPPAHPAPAAMGTTL